MIIDGKKIKSIVNEILQPLDGWLILQGDVITSFKDYIQNNVIMINNILENPDDIVKIDIKMNRLSFFDHCHMAYNDKSVKLIKSEIINKLSRVCGVDSYVYDRGYLPDEDRIQSSFIIIDGQKPLEFYEQDIEIKDFIAIWEQRYLTKFNKVVADVRKKISSNLTKSIDRKKIDSNEALDTIYKKLSKKDQELLRAAISKDYKKIV